MKKIIIIISFLVLITGCGSSYKPVSYEDAVSLIENKRAVIIDVRTLIEYEEGHINNAINIPSDDIEIIQELILSKDTYLILYCRSGKRSRASYDKLVELGYKNVYDLGSIDNWEE